MLRIMSLNQTVLLLLVLLALMTSLLSAVDNVKEFGLNDPEWRSGWLQNFSTEMFGAIATFAVFELLVGRRREKQTLIRQLGSKDNATAINAAEELRAAGWLTDGSLKGANLQMANMEEAYLPSANLAGVNLRSANLAGADLSSANLQGAFLRLANLAEANLIHANLRGAYLGDANLQGAKFAGILFGNYYCVTIDATTTLPDGNKFDLEQVLDATGTVHQSPVMNTTYTDQH